VSRAFVKEGDDRPEPPIKRSLGDAPNYVTSRGLALLHEALARARERGDARNVEYFEGRIACAIPMDEPAQPGVVAFGTTVVVCDEAGGRLRLSIVGEDEADPARGALAWSSPFAQALLERRAGERVVVARPAGPAAYVVEAIER